MRFATRQEAIEEAIRLYLTGPESEGIVEIHRRLPGPHREAIGTCWCEPYVIDLKTAHLDTLGDFDGEPILRGH